MSKATVLFGLPRWQMEVIEVNYYEMPLVTLYYIILLKADWGIFWGRQLK